MRQVYSPIHLFRCEPRGVQPWYVSKVFKEADNAARFTLLLLQQRRHTNSKSFVPKRVDARCKGVNLALPSPESRTLRRLALLYIWKHCKHCSPRCGSRKRQTSCSLANRMTPSERLPCPPSESSSKPKVTWVSHKQSTCDNMRQH